MDVDELLGRMTIEEKVAQLGCVWVTELVRDDRFDPDAARRHLGHGTGHVTRIGASTGLRPSESTALMNEIQRFAVEETRLGIPVIVHEESTGGYCARDATVFPQAIGLAATWDEPLVEEVATVIREQLRAVGARHTLAPVLDVARDPRWGRVEETHGEDPYLAGRIGTAYVRGMQTPDLRSGVVATGKHFLGYGMELPATDCYVLDIKERLGLFDEPYVDASAAPAVFDTVEQRALARRAAAASIVLLANDGVLPLDPARGTRLAVLGPAADDRRLLQGDYHYPAHAEITFERQSADLLPAAGGAFQPGPHYTAHVTPLEGVREMFTEITHVAGCTVTGAADGAAIAEAAAAARAADVALIFVGGESGLQPHSTVGEARDATSLGLTGAQPRLVDAVLATGTPTVVVLVSGRVHAVPEIASRANALVQAWLPGEEGGHGLADVLTGAVDATGRLPVSMSRSVGQVPVYRSTRWGGGRSMFHGGRAGTEVVQLLANDEVASVVRPRFPLVGFAKVPLDAGSVSTVRFTVHPSRLAFYNASMRLVVEPGAFTFRAGSATATVTLTGDVVEHRRRAIVATTVDIG